MITDAQQVFRDHLNTRIQELQTKNPRFSQRALAIRLGITSGALSGILSGKRHVSQKMCVKMLDQLGSPEQKKEEILRIFQWSSDQSSIRIQRQEVSEDVFSRIASPDHFNVLTLLQTKTHFFNEKQISKKVDLPLDRIRHILNDLLSVRCVQMNSEGRYVPIPDAIIFGDQTTKESIQKYHCDSMDEAKTKLASVELELREFRSLCIPADPDKVDQIKDVIKKFRDEVSNLMGQGNPTEVYKLNVQFYPVTTPQD